MDLASLAMPGMLRAVSTGRRPNFVVMIADDLGGGDLGCYGHPRIRTPNIDRLASDRLRFTHAFLTCSSCSPSRCSIMTGRYPHNTGAEELHQPLPADQVVFAEYNWHDYQAHERGVRSKRYLYIRNAFPDLRCTPPADAVRSITFQAMRRLHAEGEEPLPSTGWHGQTCLPVDARMGTPNRRSTVKPVWRCHPAHVSHILFIPPRF